MANFSKIVVTDSFLMCFKDLRDFVEMRFEINSIFFIIWKTKKFIMQVHESSNFIYTLKKTQTSVQNYAHNETIIKVC